MLPRQWVIFEMGITVKAQLILQVLLIQNSRVIYANNRDNSKNLGDKIPFVNNPAEQDSSNDMMGWWLKNNMTIPENYLQTFTAAMEGGSFS